MSIKNAARPFNIFNSISTSGTQVFTSSVTTTIYLDGFCYAVSLSGIGPTGVLEILASSDYNPQLPESGNAQNSSTAGTWFSIASVSIGIGTPSPVVFDYTPTNVPYIQCKFTSSTASGTLTGWVSAKSYG